MARTALAAAAGFAAGVLGLAAFRLAAAPPPAPVHHHANWAVYVDGRRMDLTGERFMEDVSACAGEHGPVQPASRVHLHNGEADVVHVHHAGATWGHLMANLRMTLGDDLLRTRDGTLLRAGAGMSFKFILNGRPELSVYNQAIAPGDRLLVSFGAETPEQVLREQFPRVASHAPEYDARPDPAACSGAAAPGLGERLRHAFVG